MEEYKQYILHDLMAGCKDFLQEKSSMKHLFQKLSSLCQNNIYLLTSPNYHREISGLGIEFIWGLCKKVFRNITLQENKTKDGFYCTINKCLNQVTVGHLMLFAARVRGYMMAYQNINPSDMTYEEIEKCVHKTKCHRNMTTIFV